MGQADDLDAGITEALLHAILVGTICFGDGDFSVPDSDGVESPVGGGQGEFLIFGKGNGDAGITAFDLRPGGRRALTHQEKGRNKAQRNYCCQ